MVGILVLWQFVLFTQLVRVVRADPVSVCVVCAVRDVGRALCPSLRGVFFSILLEGLPYYSDGEGGQPAYCFFRRVGGNYSMLRIESSIYHPGPYYSIIWKQSPYGEPTI